MLGGRRPGGFPKEGSFPVHVDHHHFYFDISAMEKGEQMLKAEFRVFKLKRTRRSRRSEVQHFCKVSGEIVKHLILLYFLLILSFLLILRPTQTCFIVIFVLSFSLFLCLQNAKK